MFGLIILFFLTFFNVSCVLADAVLKGVVTPKKFVVVTTSYNNIDFVDKYLESIFSQKCDEDKFTFRVIYCDDCSEDGTWKAVEAYKKRYNLGDKLNIIRNNARVGGHENIYNVIHSYCYNDEIIVIVDGDDWLACTDVFEILYSVYSNADVWLTYGQFERYPNKTVGFCKEIPAEIINANSVRFYGFVSSHLRTFYAWLYKRIKKEDIMFGEKFVPVCGDVAIMIPMLEMAGFHSKFIPEVLYVYNTTNPNSYWHNRAKNRKNAKIEQQGKDGEFLLKFEKKRKKKRHHIIHGLRKKSGKNCRKKKNKELYAVILSHIRKDLIPYNPLEKSDWDDIG
jgi:glycosyltransferase involved in cell wall biosynthesis